MSTIYQLPVRNDLEAYSFICNLDGQNYTFNFRFNYRLNLWLMDVLTSTGTDLIDGEPVQTNRNLLERFAIPALPPGGLLAYDTTGNNADAGRNNFGTDVLLLYQAVNT